MATALASPEYDAMVQHTSTLVEALGSSRDISSFLSKLVNEGVVSSAELDAIVGVRSSPEKARKLVSYVTAKTIIGPEVFQVFLSVLSDHEEEPQLKQVSKILQESVGSFETSKQTQQTHSIPEMQRKFEVLVVEICKSLCERIAPSSLYNVLVLLCAFEQSAQSQDLLLKKCLNQVNEASNNESIFKIIEPFMSFFNPGVLQYIVGNLGTDDDQKSIKEYMKAVEEFSNGCIMLPCILSCKSDLNHFQELKVRLNEITKCMKYIQQLKSVMAKIFRLNECTLQVTSLHEELSQTIVTFVLPKFVHEKIFPPSCEQSKKLQDLGVLSPIECGAYRLYSFAYYGDNHETVPVHTVEIPCLGRPFKLGMCYDFHKDNLICLTNVFGTKTSPDTSTFVEIKPPLISAAVQTNDLAEKILKLDLYPGLKLSLMSGLVNDISGSAKYWNDCRSSKQIARVCLKYESTSHIHKVELDKLCDFQCYTSEDATHVVTRVEYGLDVIFVFERKLDFEEDHDYVQENIQKMVNAFFLVDDTEDSSPIEADENISVRVYSDVNLGNHACTLHEAVDIFRRLQDLIMDTHKLIPKMVSLYPLDKVDEKCSVSEISVDLVSQVQKTFQKFDDVVNEAYGIMSRQENTLTKFQYMKSKLLRFSEIVVKYKQNLKESLGLLIPKIRSGKMDEVELANLKVIEDTKTNYQCLCTWLSQAEKETARLQMFHEHVKDIDFTSSGDLQSIVEGVDSPYIVCFAFNIGDSEDQPMEHILQQENQSALYQDPWWEDAELNKRIVDCVEQFKSFAKLNQTRKNVQFLVTNSCPIHCEIGSILLFECSQSCIKWEPPGAPGKPQASETTCYSVKLEWTKPLKGKNNVKYYTITCHPVDSQTTSILSTSNVEESVTVSGLTAGKKYEFIVQAESVCGIGPESEVSDHIETPISLSISNPELQLSNSVVNDHSMYLAQHRIGKPRATSVTHNSIQIIWTDLEPFNVTFYNVSFCEAGNPNSEWNKLQTKGTEETITITDLLPCTKYCFKIDDNIGVESEISDPVKTLDKNQPGKPYALKVTHDSIQLQWIKPECEDIMIVDRFTVLYCSNADHSKWRKKMTEDTEDMLIITGLSPQTKYIFKVRPELEDGGVGTESEVSDPVLTLATSQPGKPIATTISHDSISLKWTKPNCRGEKVDSYTIVCYSTDSVDYSTLRVGAQETVTIHELCPRTKYSFKVQPKVGNLTGSVSEQSMPIETKPTSPPGKPTLFASSYDRIEVKWTKPKYGSDIIKCYIVTILSKSMSFQLITQGLQESVVVGGLDVNTGYEFKVHPRCKDDADGSESELSDSLYTKATSPPGKPTPTNVTHNSIEIKWTKPVNGSENIKGYSLSYQLDNQELQKSLTVKDALKATFSGLNLNSSYVFKVSPLCSNGIGGMESEISNPIKTKATSKPGKPECSNVMHTSITVSWSHPEYGHKNIDSYMLCYHSLDSPKNVASIKVAKKTTDHKVINLIPHTKYTFTVQPICQYGEGAESVSSDVVETKYACKPGKPQAMYVGHDSIKINWSNPKHYHRDITHYHIRYYKVINKSKEKSFVSNVDHSRQDTQCSVIENLEPHTKYIVKVFPVLADKRNNYAIESEESDIITTRMTSPPGKPFVIEKTHDSITLEWNEPEWIYGTSSIYHYTVKVIQTKSDICFSKDTSNNQPSIVITKLNPNQTFNFWVTPICEGGIGSQSESSDPIETDGFCKPGKLMPSLVTNNSVQLTWNIPQYHSAFVDNYTLSYGLYNDQPHNVKWIKSCNVSKFGNADIKELQPCTTYVFRIHPECSKTDICVEDSFSEPITTRVTSPPGKPQALLSQHDRIEIQWTKPEFGYEKIKSYTVVYKSLTSREMELGAELRESVIIEELTMNTCYQFKVCPECVDDGVASESEYSDTIYTKATSPPGKPQVRTDQSLSPPNGISIKWSRPRYYVDNITSYTVKYCKLSVPYQWMPWPTKVAGGQEQTTITTLKANEYYQFKIQAVCTSVLGSESEISNPVKIQPICKPGNPRACDITHKSIDLTWDRPEYGYNDIEYYVVTYHMHRFFFEAAAKWLNRFIQKSQHGNKEFVHIENLKPDTLYTFKVTPKCRPESDTLVVESEYVSVQTSQIPLAERTREKWKRRGIIQSGPMELIKVPVTDDTSLQGNFKKCHVGSVPRYCNEKLVMLVGETGAGKSTLINSIVNYIYDVKLKDPFRFVLITNESTQSQAHSQTPGITAYSFYPPSSSPLNFALTIVDTPGFGDTMGIERDRKIMDDIKQFFRLKLPYGIDQIHAIGFVAQAGLARLTPTQKYVFDSILAMFGKDIENNICLMATFADCSQQPQVLHAVKEASIKCSMCLKFNNSVLLNKQTDNENTVDNFVWDMNHTSLDQFFAHLGGTEAKSLTLTKEVLEKREQLEVLIKTLHEKLTMGLGSIQELQIEQKVLMAHSDDLLRKMHDVTYEVEIPKVIQEWLPKGQYVTNCRECNETCHFPCTISDNTKKYNCYAMGGHWLSRNTESKCTVCSRQCSWKSHQNDRYRYKVDRQKETRTLEDLIKNHAQRTAESSESGADPELDTKLAEGIEATITKKLEAINSQVLDTVIRIKELSRELNEIALKPSPLNEVEYIELLIETEKREANDGFLQRVNILEELKDRATLLYQAQAMCTEESHTKLREIHTSKSASGIGGILLIGADAVQKTSNH